MTYLEGKPIAEKIKENLKNDVQGLQKRIRLGIVLVGKDPVSERFISLKEKFALEIGVETKRYEIDDNITTSELRTRMRDIVHESANNGIIVQLPLPEQIDTQSILNSVIPEKDVDVLSARSVGNFQVGKSRIMPPVAGAVRALLENYRIDANGKRVVVLGYGRLVGQPLATWFLSIGAIVTVVGSKEKFDGVALKQADIIVSGIGRPKSITGEYIKEGAVVIDVGSSESGGEIVGDIDMDSIAEKAAFTTPPTGGVGPLTVALVFQNLLTLAKN